MEIVVNGLLSDLETKRSVSFKVEYLKPQYFIDPNTPPFIQPYQPLVEVYFEDIVTRKVKMEPIGEIIDNENDDVTISFDNKDHSFINFDEDSMEFRLNSLV